MSPENDNVDRELINQVVSGDVRAFETLVERHRETVSRFVFKVVNHPQDHEEVCQDVFVKLYQNLPGFRFDSKFTTWLYQIAYRTAISSTRRKRIETEEYEDTLPAEETDMIDEDRIRTILDQALSNLKLEERTIVTLHYLQEVSVDEISDIVDRPAGTVKSILHRVRQKLHDSLSRTEPALREAI